MNFSMRVPVKAPRQDVWRVITDIENAKNTITGIEKIEVLAKPPQGIVGLKWRETRTLFGKTATETMWITDAVEGHYYDVEAHSHGTVYRSKMHLSEQGGVTELGMDFDAEPQTLTAKILAITMGFMFKGATEKALRQDLNDIKAAVEADHDGTR